MLASIQFKVELCPASNCSIPFKPDSHDLYKEEISVLNALLKYGPNVSRGMIYLIITDLADMILLIEWVQQQNSTWFIRLDNTIDKTGMRGYANRSGIEWLERW